MFGQTLTIELGFRQGGPAGYGLRRLLIDRDGNSKELLSRGKHKSIQTDRVILVPGPEHETRIVRQMYDFFTRDRKSELEIANWLNSQGLVTDFGHAWTRGTVHQILTNPKYAGGNVYNRRSFKLKRKRINNPPEMWVRRDDAFTPVISVEQFREALEIVQKRSQNLTDEQFLDRLRFLLTRFGTISGILIDEADDVPSSAAYRHRFGSLLRAYALIGYTPGRDFRFVEVNRAIRAYHRSLAEEIVHELRALGATVDWNLENDLLTVNREFTASLVLSRCRELLSGSYRWLIRLDNSLTPDVTIAARLKPGNLGILDYYLLPGIDVMSSKLRLAVNNNIVFEVYRFDNLNFFMSMARRSPVEEVA